jgi:hypothetical protein
MPAAAWHVCLPEKNGSDRRMLEMALLTATDILAGAKACPF